ncbi:hypothetical protein L2E82_30104 [Cichorium intybus]|uniref:Uncharacterized protein n=1 Tax=Cichorium intybus TaxID=13427 RepID=A0ACB9CZR9_CICIN|nr:hypothetical protein L2E82_30104 [Cichorium intybus]
MDQICIFCYCLGGVPWYCCGERYALRRLLFADFNSGIRAVSVALIHHGREASKFDACYPIDQWFSSTKEYKQGQKCLL